MPRQKYQKGVIPLLILVVIGIAVFVGGAYIIRNEFVKTGITGKASLDEQKVRTQIDNPEPLPELTPEPDAVTQQGKYNYIPPAGNEDEPYFTITAPSGWNRVEMVDKYTKVKFEDPVEDEEIGEEGLATRANAKVQVLMIKGSGEGDLDSFLDYFLTNTQADFERVIVTMKSKRSFSGLDSYYIELDAFRQGVTLKFISFVMVKGEYGVVVYGGTLKSDYDEHADEIWKSINSFSI